MTLIPHIVGREHLPVNHTRATP